MVGRRLLAALLALALSTLAACGRGGSGKNGDDAADTTTTAVTLAPDTFTCPVGRKDVEDVYEPIDFRDSTDAGQSCTYLRFDESGSLIFSVDAGGAATYAAALAKLPNTEKIDGVGDEATYSEGRTELVARSGDRVLTVQNSGMAGLANTTDTAAQRKAVRDASIAIAKKALASG